MQKDIDDVNDDPGLQFDAKATVAPASMTRRAAGEGWRGVEWGGGEEGGSGLFYTYCAAGGLPR